LLQDLENPPSLLELAKLVGLNDYKLKSGFRHVFGTTVFGYLHQQRMQQAYRLLTTSDLTVTEVANQVGYTSLSAFSTAFKKFFGISPSRCRVMT
jgi:AraC family transcriptional regulator, transcriptional activator of the genes for pyochelin and ferripyochelin receptors